MILFIYLYIRFWISTALCLDTVLLCFKNSAGSKEMSYILIIRDDGNFVQIPTVMPPPITSCAGFGIYATIFGIALLFDWCLSFPYFLKLWFVASTDTYPFLYGDDILLVRTSTQASKIVMLFARQPYRMAFLSRYAWLFITQDISDLNSELYKDDSSRQRVR